jgi:hypothetical protein
MRVTDSFQRRFIPISNTLCCPLFLISKGKGKGKGKGETFSKPAEVGTGKGGESHFSGFSGYMSDEVRSV